MEKVATERAILADDVEKFVKALKSFFENIPYNFTDRQNERSGCPSYLQQVLAKRDGDGFGAV